MDLLLVQDYFSRS